MTKFTDNINYDMKRALESPILDYANRYLAALKTGSKDVLASLLANAQNNKEFKQTVINFNRAFALMAMEKGLHINIADSEVLFNLTLNYPEIAATIFEVLQPNTRLIMPLTN